MDTYAYILDGNLYINLTNSCTNNCIFCIRSLNDTVVGANLTLSTENVKASDVIEQIKNKMQPEIEQVVFCGYGEPTLKIEILKEVAGFLRKTYPNKKIRINTNGQANFVFGRDIVSEIAPLIDKVSISLNSDNAKQYQELSQSKFGEEIYEEVKKFAKMCVNAGIETDLSIVIGYKDYEINIENCKKIASDIGANLRIREWLDEGYN